MRSFVMFGIILSLGSSHLAEAQYGGAPYRSYTDQMVLDRINLRRSAERRATARKHLSNTKLGKTAVPKITGLSYDAARKRLLAAGWKPILHPQSYANSSNIQSGNGQIFWKRGYREIADSSGMGRAFCRFQFQDAKGRTLNVTTAGEEDPNSAYKAVVSSHSLKANRKP